jgi:hypothetical protein
MDSPANCNLLGTIDAFREAAIKNTEIKITDKKTKNIGFVVYGLSPNTGGNSKSAVEGGLKPPSSASNIAT